MNKALLAVAMAAFIAGPAVAAGTDAGTAGQSSSAPSFDGLDTDHDGTISKSEARRSETVKEHFKAADTNHDGKLDQAEFSALESVSRGSGSQPGAGATTPGASQPRY